MRTFFETLRRYLAENPSVLGDGESVLELLYECHNEIHPYDDARIKADFHALYEAMNGMPLREMDRIVYPVCTLCRDHERSGFIEGVKIGMWLAEELV